MAKGRKDNQEPFDVEAAETRLRKDGPAGLYMLRGEEDYLRDEYLGILTGLCLGEDGEGTFNHHRFRGPGLDMEAFRDAVESVPFMGDRTLIEVRDFDVNRTAGYDPDLLKSVLSDLPEWATVVFLFSPGYNPDGKLKVVRLLHEKGVDIEFYTPGEDAMIRWVRERAESHGKRISSNVIHYLLVYCGSRMNTLIPEITKLCGYAAGEEITRADIDAVATQAPETTVFHLTDALGARRYDRAASLLGDLLADRDETPQGLVAMISEQFRRYFVARIAADEHLPDSYITDCIPTIRVGSYPMTLLKRACRNFSRERLARAVRLCVECDFGMKDNGPDEEELLKELILRLALDKA